jgi:tRNA 2-thiouridine synthesizing protein D
MKYALNVYGAPYSHAAPLSALRFAEAATRRGHDIVRVFFYHDGVHTANELAVTPQDELDITAAWVAFAERNDTELTICIAAALKRGLLDAGEANRYEKDGVDVHPAFAVVGLGQLVDAAMTAERVVTFGP